MSTLKIYTVHVHGNGDDIAERLNKTIFDLHESGVVIIEPNELMPLINGQRKKDDKDEQENYALFTFDDGGEQSDGKIADLLRISGVKAISFVIPLWHTMEAFRVNWDYWIENNDVFELGSHSLTHSKVPTRSGGRIEDTWNILTYRDIGNGEGVTNGLMAQAWDAMKRRMEMPDETRLRWYYEIFMSKEIIERATGKECRFFSFPWGEFSEEIETLVADAGYHAAFTTYMTEKTVYTIPRIDFDGSVHPDHGNECDIVRCRVHYNRAVNES